MISDTQIEDEEDCQVGGGIDGDPNNPGFDEDGDGPSSGIEDTTGSASVPEGLTGTAVRGHDLEHGYNEQANIDPTTNRNGNDSGASGPSGEVGGSEG